MAAEIPKHLGSGGARLDSMTSPSLYDLLIQIKTDLDEVKAKFDAHQHNLDGTAIGAATDITGTPVTGTTTGTPTGGTATAITVGLTAES